MIFYFVCHIYTCFKCPYLIIYLYHLLFLFESYIVYIYAILSFYKIYFLNYYHHRLITGLILNQYIKYILISNILNIDYIILDYDKRKILFLFCCSWLHICILISFKMLDPVLSLFSIQKSNNLPADFSENISI